MAHPEVPIAAVDVSAFKVPTATPESDGTLEWSATTLVLAEVTAGSVVGLGFTYADKATATLIGEKLGPAIVGRDAMAINGCWNAMVHVIRNLGRPGIASMAIAAVDNALWDLKARLMELPLVALLSGTRDAVPVYGSGGFTSYSVDALQSQLRGWSEEGFARVKMKVGREPEADVGRVEAARSVIGETALFVDANGAYGRKQALEMARRFADCGVSWFEEPVSSDDLAGLRLLRDRCPAEMDVAAGEYGYDLGYFRAMLESGAVDVLQADATRCAGITGFLGVAALCEAFQVPLSGHCAPSMHAHVCCAATPVRHLEYFFDHARIETMLFDGALVPRNGQLVPDRSRLGSGLVLKRADAGRYRV